MSRVSERSLNPADFPKADEPMKKMINTINAFMRDVATTINGRLDMSNLAWPVNRAVISVSELPLKIKAQSRPVAVMLAELNRDKGKGSHQVIGNLGVPDWTWETGNVFINAIPGLTDIPHDVVFVVIY